MDGPQDRPCPNVDAAAGPAKPRADFYECATPDIKLGWRMRLGVLVPSVNTVAEPQIQAMLPVGVSLHCTRLKLVGSTQEELLGMTERVEEASQLLADAQPHRILFHCTATTTFDVAMAARLKQRIEQATGIPATVTSEALIAAFAALGVRRLVLVTPYIASVNEREVAFLRHHGIDVLREHGLGLPGGKEFATVEPAVWYRLAMEHRHDEADAYFISCAQVRAAEVIEVLECDLGRPVVTSNTAAVWRCLRESGLQDAVRGFGRLLTI
ncbi:MAG: arylmalonate decarboxylase [Hyphomicrobiales bacterium]